MENPGEALIGHLKKNDLLHDPRLERAFREVPVEAFVPRELFDPVMWYVFDSPIVFYQGASRQLFRTISAPHMICIMLEGLALGEDDKVLQLQSKSGYIATLASYMVPRGSVTILEANGHIARETTSNLENYGLTGSIRVVHKNPLSGMESEGPWKRILVTGAIEEDALEFLLWQLDPDKGLLFGPIDKGDEFQVYTQFMREGDEFFSRAITNVRFGPLEYAVSNVETGGEAGERGEGSHLAKTRPKVLADEKRVSRYTNDIIKEFLSADESHSSTGETALRLKFQEIYNFLLKSDSAARKKYTPLLVEELKRLGLLLQKWAEKEREEAG
ncbi:MAG: protein-L-isoaspartate O-methyltransferase family protein [Promethearchaeota archaeon]